MSRSSVSGDDLPQELGDGLVLRRATPADVEALAAFNAYIHRERGTEEPNRRVAAWVRDLMSGKHPTFCPEDFTLVEDVRAGQIVSSLNLISQTWAYEGIPFKVGRVELVGTHPDYRNRGLVRAQFEVIHRWSAERGEMVQAISGIPFYYRQFGYEMTMTLGGGRVGYRAQVPELKNGASEPYHVRPADEADVPFISALYEHSAQRQPIYCLRDERMWRYELNGRSELSDNKAVLCVIEGSAGERVGFLAHANRLERGHIWLWMYELEENDSWAAVTPSIIRYLWATGEAYAARDNTCCESLGFNLGEEHPAYASAADWLPSIREPYAWYIRVADVAGFVRHIALALERRLAGSAARGYTGTLRISFYRSGLLLNLEKGRVVEVQEWRPTPSDWGDAAFPGLTFLHLLFGYRTCDELRHIFPDCWMDNSRVRAVLEGLFPKRPSHVWAIE